METGKARQQSKSKTIRAQIFFGYINMIVITLVLVIISLVYLNVIRGNYLQVDSNRRNEVETQKAVSSHCQWLENLNMAIHSGGDFTGSLDPATCSLGEWLAGVKEGDIVDAQVRGALESIKAPHQEIHALAKELLDLRESDEPSAYARYAVEVKPKAEQVIAQLTSMSARYGTLAEASSRRLQNFIGMSIVTSIFFAILAVILALTFAGKISAGISKPIAAVAMWSKKLSLGMDDLSFDAVDLESNRGNEVGIMVESFRKMAQSISDNVNVVKRVADGDMTAFVNIRSTEDSLGRNLYRMVQSNDLLFADIIEIAQTVAGGSEEIAKASASLAQSASIQANAVQSLSETVDEAGRLIRQNADKTTQAARITDGIRRDVINSNDQMTLLSTSVVDIREASRRISTVIKSIEDIAFQTNILALNASIEAARAGVAGKGFAVVADEVRELALKSANAADETKVLIQDTINKTDDGSHISDQAVAMFERITLDVSQIVDLIADIAAASDGQLVGIEQVRGEIVHISQAATGNAALSEESAASSVEMRENAEQLKKAMSKFNLRKRQRGHAYIPPEKKNDPAFIREAEENYRAALRAGQIGGEPAAGE